MATDYNSPSSTPEAITSSTPADQTVPPSPPVPPKEPPPAIDASSTQTVPPPVDPPATQNISPLPEKSTLDVVNTQKNTGKKIKITVGIVIGVAIVSIAAAYLFIVQPRTRAVKRADEILPLLTQLKISMKSVISEMDKINFIISQENKIKSTPTETSSAKPELPLASWGITERSISDLNRKQNPADTSPDPRVAGAAETKDTDSVTQFRQLKDETLKTDEFIKKSQADLNALAAKANDPVNLNNSQKGKLMQYVKIQNAATPYLNEAQKVSNYFKEVSDALIEMETKVNSFKLALSSVAGIMSQAQNEENRNPDTIQSSLTQVQIFLDQANKDTSDIKSIVNKLSLLPKDSLPQGAEKYHAHNIKLLNLVADYFTTSSNSLQGFITSTNVTVNKVKNENITVGDLMVYSAVLSSIDESTVKADTKFISDLQTLVGEEKSLVMSFWQNNTILASGSLIETEINAYEKTLNNLKRDNSLPWTPK